MTKKRMRAQSTFKARKDKRPNRKGSVAANVPAQVRDLLQAQHGDVLVFEEGTTWVAERAAGRGLPYLVVYLEKPAPPTGAKDADSAPKEPTADAVLMSTPHELLPLEEEVRRRRSGDRRH